LPQLLYQGRDEGSGRGIARHQGCLRVAQPSGYALSASRRAGNPSQGNCQERANPNVDSCNEWNSGQFHVLVRHGSQTCPAAGLLSTTSASDSGAPPGKVGAAPAFSGRGRRGENRSHDLIDGWESRFALVRPTGVTQNWTLSATLIHLQEGSFACVLRPPFSRFWLR
jgi:hypothetical protein